MDKFYIVVKNMTISLYALSLIKIMIYFNSENYEKIALSLIASVLSVYVLALLKERE